MRTVDIPDAEDAGRVDLVKHSDFILEWPTLAALMDELKAKAVAVVWDITVHDGSPCAFVRVDGFANRMIRC